jgi:O-antigen/teichoic acid export membrane protein
MPRNPSAGNAVRTNTLWNVIGQGLPLGVAVFFIPRLIHELGIERFGALTLVWTFLNYFGLFDLGIGRAMTQLLAGKAQGNDREEATLIWTVSGLLVILGTIAGAILFFTAPLFTAGLLRMEGSLEGETALALKGLAIALPFLIHTIALKGVLDARRRFDISNMIRIPLGVFTYGAPLLVVPFTKNLGAIVAVLLAARALGWLVNLVVVLRLLPHLRSLVGWDPKRIRELMRFGGWFTVSNIVGPVIDNMDRFFINAL